MKVIIVYSADGSQQLKLTDYDVPIDQLLTLLAFNLRRTPPISYCDTLCLLCLAECDVDLTHARARASESATDLFRHGPSDSCLIAVTSPASSDCILLYNRRHSMSSFALCHHAFPNVQRVVSSTGLQSWDERLVCNKLMERIK